MVSNYSRVPQGSVLKPLLFLVYVNDLVDNISSAAKLFADDKSLFTIVCNENIAKEQLNRDMKLLLNGLTNEKCNFEWAYQ